MVTGVDAANDCSGERRGIAVLGGCRDAMIGLDDGREVNENIFSDWIVEDGSAIEEMLCKMPVGSWAVVAAGGLPIFHDSGIFDSHFDTERFFHERPYDVDLLPGARDGVPNAGGRRCQ